MLRILRTIFAYFFMCAFIATSVLFMFGCRALNGVEITIAVLIIAVEALLSILAFPDERAKK